MSRRLFGTDGIRGRAGRFPLDPHTIRRLGSALVETGYGRVLVGRDTRRSGVWVSRELGAGIEAAGGSVLEAGVMTTPGVAALIGPAGCDVGVVVSASHNPFEDNGIKILASSGHKLSDDDEIELEARLPDAPSGGGEATPSDRPTGEQLGWSDPALSEQYLAKLLALPAAGQLAELHIVIDCANGAAFRVGPALFSECAGRVDALNVDPDGANINEGCGALHPEALARRVVSSGADLGAALDGDADRCILVDERGEIVDGDDILYVLGRELSRQGRLAASTVVSTVMANLGLERALADSGIVMVRTAVGDRYVLEAMQQQGLVLGGEQSGHVIFAEHSWAGDGLQTALLMAAATATARRPLSELTAGWKRYPQVLLNVPVARRQPIDELEALTGAMTEAHEELGDAGRLLVRYSGTEPLLRIMVEGRDREQIEGWAERLAAVVRNEIGAVESPGTTS